MNLGRLNLFHLLEFEWTHHSQIFILSLCISYISNFVLHSE